MGELQPNLKMLTVVLNLSQNLAVYKFNNNFLITKHLFVHLPI
jgi:hypothetical protein